MLTNRTAIKTTLKSCTQPHSRASFMSGFTLIEVMVALAILAVVAVAASRASSAYLNATQHLRHKTLAHFVAMNTIADMHITELMPLMDNKTYVTEQGRDWVVHTHLEPTLNGQVTRVTIDVAMKNATNASLDSEAHNSLSQLVMFVPNQQQDGIIR